MIPQLNSLQQQVNEACERLQIAPLTRELHALRTDSRQTDFWLDSNSAQSVMQQIAKLEARTAPWRTLQQAVNDLSELAALNDSAMED